VDNPVLIVEAPILDDESISKIYEFLQNLTFAFDAHYYKQLRRYDRSKDSLDGPAFLRDIQGDQRSLNECDVGDATNQTADLFDDQIPF
jgi:hypothetical protein